MNSKRKKSLQFHVESRDYFSSLATTLGLMEEFSNKEINNIHAVLKEIKHIISALKRFKKDLIHMQENYEIIKKPST